MTFNLNLPLAEAIDNLPVKNRSEWANRALQRVLDNRENILEEAMAQKVEDGRDELLANLQREPRRLAILLYNSLQVNGLEGYKPKGRYTLSELLLKAINDESGGSLRGNFPSSRGDGE